MSISKQAVLGRVDVVMTGAANVRFNKQIMDGDDVLVNTYHRVALDPGADVDAAMVAVNTDIVAQSYSAVSAADITKLKAIIAAASA